MFGGHEFFEQAFGGRMGGGQPRRREPIDTDKYYNILGVDKKATFA